MAVQNISPSLSYHPQNLLGKTGQTGDNGLSPFSGFGKSPVPNTGAVALSTEHYSSDKLFLEYSNADGDKVSLSIEHVEYQKARLTMTGDGSSEDWQKIVDRIVSEFQNFQKDVMNKFLEKMGITSGEAQQSDGSGAIAEVPEYWNAENTSQRIVDFATSFFSAFKGAGEEFLSIIKGAIEEGFAQAKDLLGELPTPVNNLVNQTYDLTMQKLDTWARANGIIAEEQTEAAAAA